MFSTDITITSKILIDNPKENTLSYPFECDLKFVLRWYTADKVEIDNSQIFKRMMGIITVLHANVKDIIKIL